MWIYLVNSLLPLFLAGYEEKQYLYGIYNVTTAKKSEQFSDKNSILMPQQKRLKITFGILTLSSFSSFPTCSVYFSHFFPS